MKIVTSMFDRLMDKLRSKKTTESPTEKKSLVVLHERINGLEKKLNSQKVSKNLLPSDIYAEMNELLQSEIRSRQRLERKLKKTSRKMDTLAAEFSYLQCELKSSTVDLDLERRKNAELRKRLQNTPGPSGTSTAALAAPKRSRQRDA